MRNIRPFVLLGVLLSQPLPAVSQSSFDWEGMADLLVERMSLERGERVLLVGRRGRFDPLVEPLRSRIAAAGAVDLGIIGVAGEAFPDPGAMAERAARRDRAGLVALFQRVDLAVMLPGASVGHPPYAAMQDVLDEGSGRTIHFHWEGAYDLNGNLMPVDARIDAFYRRALAETDYDALAEAQSAFDREARRGRIRVTTPAGTDIRFRIGDRPMTRQDGNASAARAAQAVTLIDREIELPAGAIRVAPLESSVEGTIAFPPSVWDGETVVGLVLRFERGRVVSMEAERGIEAVRRELDAAGPPGRAFREFALGFNPRLRIPEVDPWIPYYGYGAGVVRLSLGDNSELGGDVTGGYVRWNFFVDATVRVGDVVWIRDGRLVN